MDKFDYLVGYVIKRKTDGQVAFGCVHTITNLELTAEDVPALVDDVRRIKNLSDDGEVAILAVSRMAPSRNEPPARPGLRLVEETAP